MAAFDLRRPRARARQGRQCQVITLSVQMDSKILQKLLSWHNLGTVLNFCLYLVLHGLLRSLYWPNPILGNDSPTYILPAISFADNGTFHEMIFRTPLYPVFLSVHRLLFGSESWLSMACVSQILLNALAVALLTMVLAERNVPVRPQVFFGAILAIYPALFYYEAYVLTESVAFFLVSLFVYISNKVFLEYSKRRLLLLGVLVGMLPLLRPEYIAIPIGIVAFMAFIKLIKIEFDLTPKALLFLVPAIIFPISWMLRNLFVYGFLGLTLGAGGALFYHVYPYIEAGRSPDNTELVDQIVRHSETNPSPGVVFDVARVNPDGSARSLAERVKYWQDIADLTLRTIRAEPLKYLRSVGRAAYGIINPALGRTQAKRFFGDWTKPIWRGYQLVHFTVFGVIAFLVLKMLVQLSRVYPNIPFKGFYLPFLIVTMLSDFTVVILIVDSANNRIRMPFDGAILVLGVLSYWETRKIIMTNR